MRNRIAYLLLICLIGLLVGALLTLQSVWTISWGAKISSLLLSCSIGLFAAWQYQLKPLAIIGGIIGVAITTIGFFGIDSNQLIELIPYILSFHILLVGCAVLPTIQTSSKPNLQKVCRLIVMLTCILLAVAIMMHQVPAIVFNVLVFSSIVTTVIILTFAIKQTLRKNSL